MPEAIPLVDTELELPLHDWIPGGGQLKSDLPTQIGNLSRPGYSVSFQRLYHVHGQFDKGSTDEASLLVLKICPKVDSPNRCFNSFKITLLFEPAKGSNPNDDPPYIVSYEPAQDGIVYFSEHITNVTDTDSLQASLSGQAPGGGASLGLTGSKQKTKESEQRVLHKLSSGTEYDIGDEGPNVVWWRLEPATKSDGIGDSMGVAVLIRRAKSSKFVISVDSEADVGFRARMSDPWRALRKRQKTVLDPFGPSKGGAQIIPDGVDEHNLHASSTGEILKRLAFVHVPEKVAPKEFYTAAGVSAVPISKPESILASKPAPAAAATTGRPHGVSANLVPVAESTIVASLAPVETSPAAIQTTVKRAEARHPHVGSITSNSRATRHRKMAALYQRLAQLHREEAEEAEALEGAAYADEVEKAGG